MTESRDRCRLLEGLFPSGDCDFITENEKLSRKDDTEDDDFHLNDASRVLSSTKVDILDVFAQIIAMIYFR